MHQGKKGFGGNIVPFTGARRPQVDSKALQEIIDVLKHPFQTSCDTCNGLGFVRSGADCPTCHGSGRVLDDCFK